MYAVRLPQDLKDKEKAYQREEAAEAYKVTDPADIVGSLWEKHRAISTAKCRRWGERRDEDGGVTLTAIRASEEDAKRHPFIPSPKYFKHKSVVHNIILRFIFGAISNRAVGKKQVLRVHSLKKAISTANIQAAHERELRRVEAERVQRMKAATRIQSNFKGHMVRNQPDELFSCSAQIRQQCQYQKEDREDKAACTIQSLYRMSVAISTVSTIKKRHLDERRSKLDFIAARFIQRWWLRWKPPTLNRKQTL